MNSKQNEKRKMLNKNNFPQVFNSSSSSFSFEMYIYILENKLKKKMKNFKLCNFYLFFSAKKEKNIKRKIS